MILKKITLRMPGLASGKLDHRRYSVADVNSRVFIPLIVNSSIEYPPAGGSSKGAVARKSGKNQPPIRKSFPIPEDMARIQRKRREGMIGDNPNRVIGRRSIREHLPYIVKAIHRAG